VVEIVTTALDVDILATVCHVHRVGDTTVFAPSSLQRDPRH
jgi:hypothetical protein